MSLIPAMLIFTVGKHTSQPAQVGCVKGVPQRLEWILESEWKYKYLRNGKNSDGLPQISLSFVRVLDVFLMERLLI